MTAGEPAAVRWVVHQALDRGGDFPSAGELRTGLPALKASRLTSLATHLLRPHMETLDRDLRVHFESAMVFARSQAEQRRVMVGETSNLLHRLGISWVMLKGWPLAARLYPSPGCRPAGDLDLLVSMENQDTVLDALSRIGYRAEGEDRSYHTRLVRTEQGRDPSVIELHHRTGPPGWGGLECDKVLAGRRSFESGGVRLWVPSPEDEVDLLIRHYLRHAGDQAVLLLDILLLLNGRAVTHPLGSLVGDDLSRLGLERTVDGPFRWSHAVLRRWMRKRSFEQRRAERHAALIGIPLALSRSPVSALARLVWPGRPTPRWLQSSKTGAGRYTWRLRRLARFGR